MIKINIFIGVVIIFLATINFVNDYSFPVYTGNYDRDAVFVNIQVHGLTEAEILEAAKRQVNLRDNLLIESALVQRLLEFGNCQLSQEIYSNLLYYIQISNVKKDPHRLNVKYLDYELYYYEKLVNNIQKECNERN